MSTTFPTTLDSLSNPATTDKQNSPSHASQHANANDAVEALESKVGADSSAVTTSHDYKLSGVTGTDKAVSKTGTETLTNKTLTDADVNTSSGTAAFSLDASAGTGITLAVDATATPFSNAANFSGLLIINEYNTQSVTGAFVAANATVTELGETASLFSTTANNAGTVNVYLSAGVLTIQNKTTGSVSLRVMSIRMRTSN